MATTCDRRGRTLTAEDVAKHWPVTVRDDDQAEDVCPDCYGDEAYCAQGHLLPGDTDSGRCPQCEAAAKAEE